MSLEWADGVLDLFVRCGLWDLFVGISFEPRLREPVMRINQVVLRRPGSSAARYFSADLSLLGILVLVGIGKESRLSGRLLRKPRKRPDLNIILLTQRGGYWRFKAIVLLLRLVAWGFGAHYYYQREDS